MCTVLWGFVEQFEARLDKVTCLFIFQCVRLTFFLLTQTYDADFCSFLVSVVLTWWLPSVLLHRVNDVFSHGGQSCQT